MKFKSKWGYIKTKEKTLLFDDGLAFSSGSGIILLSDCEVNIIKNTVVVSGTKRYYELYGRMDMRKVEVTDDIIQKYILDSLVHIETKRKYFLFGEKTTKKYIYVYAIDDDIEYSIEIKGEKYSIDNIGILKNYKIPYLTTFFNHSCRVNGMNLIEEQIKTERTRESTK